MRFLPTLVLCLLLTNATHAQDWPQLFGPNRSGAIEDANFKPWSQKLEENWKIDIGEGFGGAAIFNNEVYFLDRKDDEFDVIRCLNLNTGKESWRYEYKSSGHFGYNGTRSVPAVDETAIYSIGCMGDVIAIDKKTHKPLWHKNLATDWNAGAPPWGFGNSPVLYKNLCIIATQSGNGLIALDKISGKEIWKTSSTNDASDYSSPVVYELLGTPVVIQIAGEKLAGFNPDNGKEIFSWTTVGYKRAIPAPIKIDDSTLFMTGGYEVGSRMLSFKKNGETFEVSEKFHIPKLGSQVQTPILFENHIYGNFNMNENLKKRTEPQGLTCIDLQGKVKWKTGANPNLDRGNVILINNYLIALDGQKGDLCLFLANPEKVSEVFRFKALEGKGGNVWAPMAYIKGNLIIRDQNVMKCLKIY